MYIYITLLQPKSLSLIYFYDLTNQIIVSLTQNKGHPTPVRWGGSPCDLDHHVGVVQGPVCFIDSEVPPKEEKPHQAWSKPGNPA